LAGALLAVAILSRLFEFLLETAPVPTNLAFCGLILGGLPAIFQKVKHKGFHGGMGACCLIFFLLVVGMAVFQGGDEPVRTLSPSLGNVAALFLVGVVAAATMVIPGVSGSMVLMLLGYYQPILALVNSSISDLLHFNLSGLMADLASVIPFGIGVLLGIFLVAKLIEWIMHRWEVETYWAIIGLIAASPIAILVSTDWSGFNLLSLVLGIVTFCLGWFAARKLGDQ
jgi:putative membrane protein